MFSHIHALGLVALGSLVIAGPCDIYSDGGTPCVTAHSTVRALYSNYTDSLYQVKRASDNATAIIKPLIPGGVANASAQDVFCASTTCLITIIYDQSGRANHLTQAPPGDIRGSDSGGYDKLANAASAPITLDGKKAYAVYGTPGVGYRNNKAKGLATGDAPEGMYAIFDGTRYNAACCFDYGNGEANSRDTGNGHMEALYFGTGGRWGSGAGKGPWIMADLENGLFGGPNTGNNPNNPTVAFRFVTAVLKGTANLWALKGGNSVSGTLTTYYNGTRPRSAGYNPMKKEGAVFLGTGGDNSNGGIGTFYEGAMTTGYPSDATEDAIQADIVAAKYAIAS